MKWRWAAAVLAAMFSVSACNRSAAGPRANPAGGSGLPNDATAQTPELQLDYAILLKDSGGAKRINEKYHFQNGDRFQLELRPAFAAHVYLLNRGPKQGSDQFLYPSPKISIENPLEPNKAITLPGGDEWFTIDSQAGVENVTLIAADHPVVEFNTPERSIARDEFENRLSLIERDYRPTSSRRFEDKEWVKLFAAGDPRTVIVMRLPLDHQ
jgi:hypothetical protein